MNDTQQLDIQVNIEDDVLNANLGDEDLQSDFTMGIIAKEYENDYNKLKNQPQINGITLEGDKSAEDLGLVSSILSPLDPVESPTKSFRESSNIFVDNNGKSLKMTLQQVKEMGSKVAKTSDEMKALLVEDNLGDLVTYLGESGGGELVGTPFEVGDEFNKGYFNTSINPDLTKLDYSGKTTSGGAFLHLIDIDTESVSNVGLLTISRTNLELFTEYSGYLYGVCLGTDYRAVYYQCDASVTPQELGLPYNSWGWIESESEIINNGFSIDESPATISYIDQQDMWGKFFSKTPFVEGSGSGGYEKNSVYIITKNNDNEIYAKKVDAEPELPKVTSADEGKFLRVNSAGVWVAEVVPRAEDLRV